MHDEILEESVTEVQQLLSSRSSVQVQAYLSELPIKKSEDALEFWKVHKTQYPALAPLAKTYLSAPCTSVDSERLFSLAGHIIDDRRNRLAGERAEMLLFVKKNMPLMFKDKKWLH